MFQRRAIAALLLLAAIHLTTSVRAATSSNKNYRIVLAPKSINSPYFAVSRNGCMDAARRLGVTCLYEGPEELNAKEQAEILDELIESGSVDGIAVSVTDADILTPVIEKAVSRNIPVVTFDSDAPKSSRSAYIGTNNTFMGEQLGKVLKQLRPEGGTYGIVSNSAPNIMEREHGLRSSLKEEMWQEISISPTDMLGNDTVAMEQMFLMAEFQTDALVPVMGAPMRAANWKLLVEENPDITLVVGDGMPNQLELLAENYAAGLVGQKPYEMGSLAVEALVDLIEGKTVKADFIGTNLLEHTNIPLVLPELNVDPNYIGPLRYVGFVLFGLIMALALGFALWVFINRNIRVVTVAQPKFLVTVALGITLLGSSIIPLSLDDSTGHHDVAICMSAPWLSISGFTVCFAALFAKTWRVKRIFHTQKKVNPSDMQVFWPFMLFLAANMIVLTVWTIFDPLTFVRNDHEGTDGWNRIVSTYGSCRSENVVPFIVPLAVLNAGVLILGNVWAYQTRMITSEFSESKYIAIAMMSMLQALLSGIPLLFVVREQPQAYYLILTFMIFVISMVILVVIFVPKMVFALSLRHMDVSEQNRLIQECVHISLSARQGTTAEFTDDENPSKALSMRPSCFDQESEIIEAECSFAKRRSLQRSELQEIMEREAARNTSKEFASRDFMSSRDFRSTDLRSKQLAVPEEDEEISAFE